MLYIFPTSTFFTELFQHSDSYDSMECYNGANFHCIFQDEQVFLHPYLLNSHMLR